MEGADVSSKGQGLLPSAERADPHPLRRIEKACCGGDAASVIVLADIPTTDMLLPSQHM